MRGWTLTTRSRVHPLTLTLSPRGEGNSEIEMPRVTFGSAIQRHVQVPACEVEANSVHAALEAVFKQHPRVRSYVLDDQASLRKHMSVFIDGAPLKDRKAFSDPVSPTSHILVVQALSGG